MMFIEYLLIYTVNIFFSFLVFMLQNRFLLVHVYKTVQFRDSYLTTCFLESFFFYPLHVLKCTCIHYHLYALKLFIFKNTIEVHACLRASTSICQIKAQTEPYIAGLHPILNYSSCITGQYLIPNYICLTGLKLFLTTGYTCITNLYRFMCCRSIPNSYK